MVQPHPLHTLALVVVVLAGLYLVALGLVAVLAPARAERFLSGFARSATAHYTECAIRLAVGGALVLRAPDLLFPMALGVFGWMLVTTTAVLFAVPWRWHHQVAQRVVPLAVRHLRLVGGVSLAAGGLILWSAVGTAN